MGGGGLSSWNRKNSGRALSSWWSVIVYWYYPLALYSASYMAVIRYLCYSSFPARWMMHHGNSVHSPDVNYECLKFTGFGVLCIPDCSYYAIEDFSLPPEHMYSYSSLRLRYCAAYIYTYT